MNYRFFKDVQSVEELKTQYKKLAFEHHPDRGGKTEDMQAINAEYDELLKIVGKIHKTKDGKTYKRECRADVPDRFKEIINAIISFNCKIELCGSWIWVFNAYQYKDQLKELGFFWCNSKKAWAWTDNPTNNKIHYSLEQRRRMHGSEVIREEEENADNGNEQKKLQGAA